MNSRYKNIDKNIEISHTLPGDFYVCELTFKHVLENVFAKSWQLVLHDGFLEENNSVFPFDFMKDVLTEPLFLIKNKKGVKCLSNVCTHRGNILIEKPGVIDKKIVCNYHGRSFDSCGNFSFMPETSGMKNFPSREDDLQEVPSESWRQFVFTSLNPSFSLNELITNLEERVGWMPIEKFIYREDLSKKYIVDANWALYCDNYLEGFHIPFIHKDLNAVLDYKNYDVETFPYSNLQIGYGNENSDCFDLPSSSPDYGKHIAAYYFWLYPNMMFNFYPWGLSVNIVKPISIKKTEVEFKSYVWDESKLNLGAGADIDKVELEDEEIVQRVQKGVGSRFYKHGRFSPKMEKGVHHFHLLINRFMSI